VKDAFCTKCGEAFEEADKFCPKCGTARGQAAAAGGAAGGGGAVTVSGGNKTGAIVWIAMSIGLGIIPLFFVFSGVFGGGSVEGTLTATGGPHGAFRFVGTGCQSMQPFGRAGANVHGDGPNDGGVYVTADPIMGYRVDVEVPGSCKNSDGTDCVVFQVPRDKCSRWDVLAEFNGTVVNDVRQYRGFTHLTCALDDGTQITADLTYGGC